MDCMALSKWIRWLYFHGLGGSATMEYSFFKSEIANISGLPYEEIEKEQLKDYLDMTVLRVDQDWNITIG